MNILITGGKGQLGTEILRQIQKDTSVLGTPPECFKNSSITSIDLDDLDIADLKGTQELAVKVKPDIIINCAAMTNVNGCEEKKDLAFRANAIGPRNLAIVAEMLDAKLVHISTDYVFDGTRTTPYSEWDLCNPQNIYGKSKYLGEQYVRQFCPKSFIVRTAWLYGHNGNNFVKTMIKRGKEGLQINVVKDQIGNPTNAEDLAYHVLKIAASEEYGLFHCTGEGECSWYEFACKIMQYANIPNKVNSCTTEEYPQPVRRPPYSSLENRMLQNTLGNEMRNWDVALSDFIKGEII